MIASTPALPAGGAFVIMPLAAIKSAVTSPEPIPVNEMLLTGESIDRGRLTTVLRHALGDGVATFRSDVLSALTSGPLQHGAFTLFSLAVVVAAILGLAVMLLELALGAAERKATLARLATMGLGEGQRAGVVALEVLPAVITAAVAAWACALALPRVLAPDLDLSVFTKSSVAVKLAADAASFAVPLAGLAVLAAVALGIEIRSGRRREGVVPSNRRMNGSGQPARHDLALVPQHRPPPLGAAVAPWPLWTPVGAPECPGGGAVTGP